MTRRELEHALEQMGPYSVRLFLDNGTTVLVHEWEFVEEDDGLLRVIARGRQAMVAISRILLIERVPPTQSST
jgi:hypothetical protein